MMIFNQQKLWSIEKQTIYDNTIRETTREREANMIYNEY